MRRVWNAVVEFGLNPPSWWTWGATRLSPWPEAACGGAVVWLLAYFFSAPEQFNFAGIAVALIVAGAAGLVWIAAYLLDRK
jgi:hypothetical protein